MQHPVAHFPLLGRAGRRLLPALLLCLCAKAYAADFAAIDAHALKAPVAAAQSVASLAAYLIKPARNETEAARAIFRWIAGNIVYDLSCVGQAPKAEAVLHRRRAVCAGYAVLFKALAQAAGLEARVIQGNSKGISFQTEALTGGPNHAWNAVKLDGEWRLLDCTWGAGWLDGRRFRPRFTPHYFLTPAEAFADDHFPDDPRWQLLETPLSKAEYLRRVQRRPAFFEQGLRLIDPAFGRTGMETSDSLCLAIGAPRGTILSAALFQDEQDLGKGYCFTQREGDQFSLRVVFPAPGEYTLRVFVAPKAMRDGQMEEALAYKVVARAGARTNGLPAAYGAFLVRDCQLETPLARTLPADRTVDFSLTVPEAEDVLVSVNGAAHMLKSKGSGRFAGAVALSAGQVAVFARFPGQRRYEGLLQYVAR